MERLASVENQVRPITRQTPVHTTIDAAEGHLSGFVLRFGTFKRRNRSALDVSIARAASGQTKSATIDAADLEDNAFVAFRFAPFDNAPGERFTLSFRSAAGPERCVAVFVTPAGPLETRLLYGPFMVDGTRILVPPEVMVQTIDTRARGVEAAGVAYSLGHWWVDRFGVYLDGLLTCGTAAPVERVRIASGDAVADLSIEAVDPRTHRCSGYLACRAGEPIHLLVDTDLGEVSLRVVLPYEPLVRPPSPDLFLKFIDLVNSDKRSVLEVGSRKSSPFSVSNRGHFSAHVKFVGFDILPGANTDVVGDAHYLTRYFAEGSLGAAYSLTVLEHLVMPWRFAVELNRILEMGALVYHATHQTWPLHAEPNDFYRFSSEALKFLFGPNTGFEILDTHMEHRVWMYPEDRVSHPYLETPLFPGYGNSQVLARKVRDIDPIRALWDVDPDRLTERSRTYPLPRGA